jgi:hypothetical protein
MVGDWGLAESIPATAGALRKAGEHSRGILVLGVRFDLLALRASRLVGGVEPQHCPSLTCFLPSLRLHPEFLPHS